MSVGHLKSAPAGVQRSIEGSALELENRICVPSGDQDGHESFAPVVRRTGLLPSGSATKMPRSSAIGFWYAILEPSGDHAICAMRAGSSSNTTRRPEPSGSTASMRLPPPTRKKIGPLATEPTIATGVGVGVGSPPI